MANFYTLASFILPCSTEQATQSIAALQHINSEISDFANHAILKSEHDSLSHEEAIIRHCFLNHPDQDKDQSNRDLDWEFCVKAIEDGLLIHADKTINTEQAAIFTQAVLKVFDIASMVVINAAHTCDKKRPNAFGGHACTVTKDCMSWFCADDFIHSELYAHKDGLLFYICNASILVHGQKLSTQFLIECHHADDPELKFHEFVRGKYNDATVSIDTMTEITPYEFKIMSSYLPKI